MVELDFESEVFLRLLTDALRSGPGSPEWRQALGRLRSEGIQQGDEYQLLVTAREHLESGKGYRSIWAGPKFTQRLMSELERQSVSTPGRRKTTTTVAVVCAAAMLIVLLTIGYLLWNASEDSGGPRFLVNIAAMVDMTGKPNPDWRPIGRLPIEISRIALRYVPSPSAAGTGGGLAWNHPIPADEPFAAIVTLKVTQPEKNLIAQVFVSDDPRFDEDNGTTPHELVWLLQSNQAQVIPPSGRVEADTTVDWRGNVTVRITFDGPEATVEVNRKRMWSGPHALDPAKPRFVGVRFLRRDLSAGDGVVFAGVRVNMRQP